MAQNLCGYTQEEITKAIMLFNSICVENTCEECPFGNSDDICRILESNPANWDFNVNKVWRAFL